jgi:hypothetical protein
MDERLSSPPRVYHGATTDRDDDGTMAMAMAMAMSVRPRGRDDVTTMDASLCRLILCM